MLRKFFVFFLLLGLCGVLLVALIKVLQTEGNSSPSANGVVTAEDICRKNRKVPLTEYQKGMCAYLAHEFRDDPVMIEIAFCESSWRHQDSDGRVRVNRNSDKSQTVDVGLFGFNVHWNAELMQKHRLDPYAVKDNVRLAKHLRKKRKYQDWESSRSCWGWVLAQQA
jgi:hypothetical protein